MVSFFCRKIKGVSMKKIMLSLSCLALASSAYAADVTSFLNSKISETFKDQATGLDVDCEVRNPFNNNCVLFKANVNDFSITRQKFPDIATGEVKGTINLPIACSIEKHHLHGLTNPNSTSGAETSKETYGPVNYTVTFTWYVQTNPVDGSSNFYIYNNSVTSAYVNGTRDNIAADDQYCPRGIVGAIQGLNGQPIK